jgi:CHAD domain-containing protein
MATTTEAREATSLRFRDALAGLAAELERLEPAVRAGEDADALHDMRVAVRRLRSILRVARPILEEEWVDDLRRELAWIGGYLGSARDLDVLSLRLHAQAAELNGGDAVVAAELLRPLRHERQLAHDALLDALLEPRYAALSSVLAAATRALPTTRDDLELERLAEREFRRLRERGKLGRTISNAALHKRRIRAKRARYAAELVLERNPRAQKFVAEAKRFQDLLGAHQDAVVARRGLRRLARTAGRVDPAVVAGRLIQLQEQQLVQTRSEARRVWNRLLKRGDKAWR